jgi:hypothetical protein
LHALRKGHDPPDITMAMGLTTERSGEGKGDQSQMTMKCYRGSCHCGAITYEADIDLVQGTAKCNCTFCMKARSWKAFIKPTAFRLLSGGDAAVGYHSHPQASRKFFCGQCGIRTHEFGSADYMGGEFVGVFIATLDDVDPRELAGAPIRYADGRNNNWTIAPTDIAHL